VVSSLHPWVLEQAITAERETLSQQSQSSGLFLASLTQGRGPSSDLENIYWQERAHLLSAQRLAGPTKNVRIALIAGTPNLAHPALSARSIIRVDLRPTGRHGSYVENIFDEYGTAIASVLIGRETAGPCRGIARESELVVLPVGGQWVVWKDQERATLDPVDYLVALRAVVRDGIRVVCLPFTGAGHPTSIEADSLRSAADEGVIIVCPAGSDRTGEPDYPAANPNCIGVGAVDEYNRLVSNVGDWIATTVSATDIPVAVGSECYEKWSGARVGCAVVSGVVALMLTVNPELTLNQIRRILRTTGPLVLDNEGTQVQGGLRLLDAYYAVRAASEKYEGVGASN
jgi:subtilisin family serine protease